MAFLFGESSFMARALVAREKERVSNAAAAVANYIANIKKGDTVKGVPNNHHPDYGVFVTLAHGVSGLVPKGFISKDLSANAAAVLPIGVEQEFIVQNIDTTPKPKIILSTTEFKFGEGKAKPKQVEIDFNEPIDNSKVTVDDGEKELCIVLPDENDERKTQFLKSSIGTIQKESPSFDYYYSDMDDPLDKAEHLIENIFKSGLPTQVYLRNLSYTNEKKGYDVRRAGLRIARQSGDWCETDVRLPTKQTFLFEGKIERGKSFVVDRIHLIASEPDRLPYEVSLEIIRQYSPAQVSSEFMLPLLDKMVSFTKYTSQKLSLWMEYLEWSERVAKLQIKGVKYIDVSFNPQSRNLEFVLMFAGDAEYQQLKRILKRQELCAFGNRISTDRFSFKYDSEQKRRIDVLQIGNSKGAIGESFNVEQLLSQTSLPVSADNTENKNHLTISEIQEKFPNAVFVKWGFDLDDDDLDVIDNFAGDLGAPNDEEASRIISNISSKYPPDGFLALSAIGDLSLIRRFRRAISSIKNGESYNPHLEEWLFDVSRARVPDPKDSVEITHWLNPNIESNANQREAIEKMLRSKDLFLLQGPPGTGKTTVIAEAIYQFAQRGERVLLSSQSNDAVDNALERLVKVPEIRAIRLMKSSRNRFSKDDEAVEKLSEDTALRYYYESLSERISERTLGRWHQLEDDRATCEKDQSDVTAINGKILQFSQNRENEVNALHKLQGDLSTARDELKRAAEQNELVELERRNLEEFNRALSGETIDLVLSDAQLDIVEQTADRINDSDYILWDVPSANLQNVTRNEYVSIFIKNLDVLIRLQQTIRDSINRKVVDDDIELKKLQLRLQELNELMDSCPDSEFEKVETEFSRVNREIKKRKRTSQTIACELTTAHKKILSPALQDLFASDKGAFLQNVDAKVETVKSAIADMVKDLGAQLDSKEAVDLGSVRNNIAAIEGKIDAANERVQSIDRSIAEERKQLQSIAQRYENASLQDGTDALINAIKERTAALEKTYQNDKVMREDFGDLLNDFNRELNERIKDRRKLQNDNDNYLPIYINSCNVVGFSCTADPQILVEKNIHDFDVVIIDEVSKATPPELLLPLMKAKKVVLVGDHRQLPPMFKANEKSYEEMIGDIQESDDYLENEKKALSMDNFKRYKQMVTSSLFKEYFERAPRAIKASLLTQYRMHKDIMAVINRFYDNQLVCGIPEESMETAKAHGLTIKNCAGLPFVEPQKHAFWIDSSDFPNGSEIYEGIMGSSAFNVLEENIVAALLEKLNQAYVAQGYGRDKKITVGVISFYQAAVNNMRRKIKRLRSQGKLTALEVSTNTVDRFQGQERNVIITSLVRSKKPDKNGEVRLSKHVLAFERINVAFSRAQNLLFIVGAKKSFDSLNVKLPKMDSPETRTAPVYKNIMADLHRKGCLVNASCVINDDFAKRTVQEYKDKCGTKDLDGKWGKKGGPFRNNYKKTR